MNLHLYIVTEEGYSVPCDSITEWGIWFQNERDKWCRTDTIGDFQISTIFMGLDHNYGHGDPVLWETMIFDHSHALEHKIMPNTPLPMPVGQWRFVHKEDAYAFHEQKVKEFADRLAAIEAGTFQFGNAPEAKE